MDRKLVHHPILGCTDIHPLQLVLGRHLLLHQLRGLAPDVGQLLAHLRAHVLVDLDNLQLGLRDLALRLSDRRDERTPLAFEPRRIPLQSGHA